MPARVPGIVPLTLGLAAVLAACAEYHARTILDEPDGRSLGALDLAVAVDDLWSYFDRHPPDGPLRVGDGRTVSPTSIIVSVHVGDPTELRVDFDLSRAVVVGRDAAGRAHAFTLYDPQHVVGPAVVEIHRAGVEHLRFDGDVDVAALRSLTISLRGVVPDAPADVGLCFDHALDDAHAAWRPVACAREADR